MQFDAAQLTATVSYNTSDPYYRWGAQPPSFEQGSTIALMKDKDNLSMGPAFYFQQSFDKLVVLRESDFQPYMLKRSLTGAGEYNGYQDLVERGHDGEYEDYLVLEERDDQWEDEDYLVLEERGDATAEDLENFAKPADKPWFCFWNGTILEGFIFVTLKTTVSEPVPMDTDTGASETAPAAEPTVTANANQTDISAPPEAPSITSISAPPEGTPTTSFVNEDTISTPPAYPTSSPSKYPKVVKLEERRNTQNDIPTPYCQKMQIMNDGTPSPLYDHTGKLFIQYLNETEPEIPNGLHKRRRSWFEILSTIGKRDTSADSGCQCQWQIA